MSILLLMGIILTVILLATQRAWASAGVVTNVSFKLKDSTLSRNHWIAGAVLFTANAVFFAIALLFMFFIPFGMALAILICIPLSIFVWFLFSETWQGTYINKIKMACLGSLFYIVFIGGIIWNYTTLQPAYPGDDMFMAWIGVIFAMIVGLGAMSVSIFVILRNR